MILSKYNDSIMISNSLNSFQKQKYFHNIIIEFYNRIFREKVDTLVMKFYILIMKYL